MFCQFKFISLKGERSFSYSCSIGINAKHKWSLKEKHNPQCGDA